MSDATAMNLMKATWLLAVIVLTWQEVSKEKVIPRPARYVGAAMVWGILGFAAPAISYRIAAMMSCGMLLTLFYQMYQVTPAAAQDKQSLQRTA
jgi:hypothetical protein